MNRLKPEEKVFQFLDNHGVRLRALKKHETKKNPIGDFIQMEGLLLKNNFFDFKTKLKRRSLGQQ